MALCVYSQQNKGVGDFDRKIPKIRYEKAHHILGVLNRASEQSSQERGGSAQSGWGGVFAWLISTL